MSWSKLAQASAIALMTGEERQDESVTAELLRDLHEIFSTNDIDAYKTSELLDELHKLEASPWRDWYGKPLSAHGLSRLLKPYRIRTMPVWIEGQTVRGYKVKQFADSFSRYLSVRSVRSVRSEARSHVAPNAPNAPNASTGQQGDHGRPLVGDEGYLSMLVDAHEAGLITDMERARAWQANRLVVLASRKAPTPSQDVLDGRPEGWLVEGEELPF
jgi:Protein of unknown function (DUF3631)